MSGKNIARLRLFRWDGGRIIPDAYSFGWWTGKDDDLLCVKSQVATELEGELTLSPVCSSRPLALLAFVIKAILIRIDDNCHADY